MSETDPVGPLARRLPSQGGFRVGPFMVDALGHLTPWELLHPPGFHFAWRDRTMQAELADGVLSVTARLGRVPSSLGGEALRPPVFDALRGLPRALPAPWRVRVLPDHQVALDWSAPMEHPVLATSLITGLTCFLLQLNPYLDMLEEVGVEGCA
jgi:hypothetical protein